MARVFIIDEHYFALSAIVTVVFEMACFAVAYSLRIDTITDLAGSSNFIIIALLSLFLSGNYQQLRPVVLTALLCISRVELAMFLLFRVCKRRKDARFDEMRSSFGKFLGFWIFQVNACVLLHSLVAHRS